MTYTRVQKVAFDATDELQRLVRPQEGRFAVISVDRVHRTMLSR